MTGMSQHPSGTPDGPDDPDAGADGLRLLVLMRHAEAAGYSASGDQGRPLTDRARAVAQEIGRWMLAQGVRPDAVVSSPSTRTRQTWEGLQTGGLTAAGHWSDDALYNADPHEILESIQAVPADVRTLVVIGHAPGIPWLAGDLPQRLAQDADGPAGGWPPGTLAVIGHRGPWSDFPAPDSAVVAVRRP